jgi:hypothetical protein
MALCFLAGCATRVVPVPVHYRLVDHPDESRIELLYRNESSKTVCLSAEDWPNLAGKLNQVSDRVSLVVGGERFPIENFNTGYCIGNRCARRVAPGEQISGSISYDDFSLPARLKNEPKALEFFPTAYVCR